MKITKTIQWVNPNWCLPPHRVARPEQVENLVGEFRTDGWADGQPSLVGYELGLGTIQLLSGSHRWAAAIIAPLPLIPVVIYPYSLIQKFWGSLIPWAQIMDAPPVRK